MTSSYLAGVWACLVPLHPSARLNWIYEALGCLYGWWRFFLGDFQKLALG